MGHKEDLQKQFQSGQMRRQMSEQQQVRNAQAALEGQFAMDLASGSDRAFPVDRFGSPIKPGCKMLFRPQYDFIYEVVSVEPVLNLPPGAPVGVAKMLLRCESHQQVVAGQPLLTAVVVDSPKAESHAADRDVTRPPEPPPQPVGDPPPDGLIRTDGRCGAVHPLSGATCYLDSGHEADHTALFPDGAVTWPTTT